MAQKLMLQVITTLCLSVFLSASFLPQAFAQDPNDQQEGPGGQKKGGKEYDAHVGVILPNQIDGFGELSGLFGLRYGWSKKRNLFNEVGLNMVNSWGVTYMNAFFSWRMDLEVESLVGQIYVGPDIHYYTNQELDETGATASKTRYSFGGHVGGGIATPIGEALWFRSDMKFNFNPGTSLTVTFGLVMKVDKGNEQGAAENDQAQSPLPLPPWQLSNR